jgi:hypothetical protein
MTGYRSSRRMDVAEGVVTDETTTTPTRLEIKSQPVLM